LLNEHSLELVVLKVAIAGACVTDPKELRKRKAIYYPIATVFSIIMLGRIDGYVNAEKKALETIPPVNYQIPVYLPQTPTPTSSPAPTNIPQTPTTNPTQSVIESEPGTFPFGNFINPLAEQHCHGCHGNTSVNCGLTSLIYEDITSDNSQRSKVIPGNSSESLMVTTIIDDQHYASFSDDDPDKVIQWIDEGAKIKRSAQLIKFKGGFN